MPRSGPGSLMVWYILATPVETFSKPPMMRSKVDFPQPEAPIRQMNSPFWICKFTSFKAWIGRPFRLNTLLTLAMSRMGAGVRVCQGISDIVLRSST